MWLIRKSVLAIFMTAMVLIVIESAPGGKVVGRLVFEVKIALSAIEYSRLWDALRREGRYVLAETKAAISTPAAD